MTRKIWLAGMSAPMGTERAAAAATAPAPGISASARDDHPHPHVIGYRAAHMRVVAARGAAAWWPCAAECGRRAAEWAYQHDDPEELVATVNGGQIRHYSTDSSRYRPLCVPCHRRYDRDQRALRIFATW